MQINWVDTTFLLAPEILLTVGALIVLVFDLFIEDDTSPILPGFTFLVLVSALAAAAAHAVLGVNDVALFMFAADPLTHFFRLLGIGTALLVLLVSVNYVQARSKHTGEFYSLLLWVTLAVVLVAGAHDLILLYLAFEFLSITSYVLVGWLRDDTRSNEGAMKYLLFGAISSAIMLYGMSLLYGATGTTRLTEIAAFFLQSETQITGLYSMVIPALVFLLAGIGFKISLVPFHQWAPDAYEGAPTPVAAFLSVGSKGAGFAVLSRVLLEAMPAFQEHWTSLLVVLSILTMTLGNLVALRQTNMKRLLAYSSIAQAGYILMGLAAYTAGAPFPADGLSGVLVYLVAYLFTNVGVFIGAVIFEQSTGSVAISDYAGLVRRSPWLAFTFVVFFLSLAGLPPTAGFVGKLAVFYATVAKGLYFLAIIGVLNSVVSVYYYFNVIRQMFFMPAPEGAERVRFPASMGLALAISFAGTLLIGFYPEPFLNLANMSRDFISALPLL